MPDYRRIKGGKVTRKLCLFPVWSLNVVSHITFGQCECYFLGWGHVELPQYYTLYHDWRIKIPVKPHLNIPENMEFYISYAVCYGDRKLFINTIS